MPPLRGARILVGFPAGGGSDHTARILAEGLQGRYAASVIVENRPGAGGRLAIEAVTAAEPDGTVLLLTPPDPLTLYPHIYGDRLRYRPRTDLVAVSLVCLFHIGLAVGPGAPVHSFAEFVDWARGRAEVQYGVPGMGTYPHFLGVELGRKIGTRFSPVAYRGGAPALQDALAGHVPAVILGLGDLAGAVRAGLVKLLAVTAPSRLPHAPDAPTFSEVGYPDLNVIGWHGVLLPARASHQLVQALAAAVAETVALPAARAAFARVGATPFAEPPDIFGARLARETEAWAVTVTASGFQAQD